MAAACSRVGVDAKAACPGQGGKQDTPQNDRCEHLRTCVLDTLCKAVGDGSLDGVLDNLAAQAAPTAEHTAAAAAAAAAPAVVCAEIAAADAAVGVVAAAIAVAVARCGLAPAFGIAPVDTARIRVVPAQGEVSPKQVKAKVLETLYDAVSSREVTPPAAGHTSKGTAGFGVVTGREQMVAAFLSPRKASPHILRVVYGAAAAAGGDD